MDFPLYSQTDGRWSWMRLGLSPLRMGEYGCAATGVAIIEGVTPDKIARQNQAFTLAGLINWWAITLEKVKFDRRVRYRDITAIDEDLAAGKRVLLEVDTGLKSYPRHWVVAVAKDGNDYKIIDPLGGVERYASHYPRIVGSAHFDVVEVEIPEWAKESVEKAKASGIITNWENPFKQVGDEVLEWSLEKAGLLDPEKHEGFVSLVRWAVVLDKLGKLDK